MLKCSMLFSEVVPCHGVSVVVLGTSSRPKQGSDANVRYKIMYTFGALEGDQNQRNYIILLEKRGGTTKE